MFYSALRPCPRGIMELAGFKLLWNPWRYEYIRKIDSSTKCVFCELPRHSDEDSLIIFRGKLSYVVMNAYPYNTGHLLIVPYRHVGDLSELTDEEYNEMCMLVRRSVRILREAFNPDGFNIGINIGRAAGAGVPGHIHFHVVPRWVGDANFIAIIGSTKTLPMALHEGYHILKSKWKEK